MDIEETLNAISKKQDKILQMLTKVSKALHLVPVTEKEERAMQIAQRENFSIAAKVNDELNAMESKEDDQARVRNMYDYTQSEVFADVVGDDILGGMFNAGN